MSRSNLLDDVRRYCRREALLREGEPVHVAVSGGVDSMVLLDVLSRAGHRVSVLHVDHGLRGEESDGDRTFLEAYCQERGIVFRFQPVDVLGSIAPGRSKQMVARELRYTWFRQVHAEDGLPIAMGHHADDDVETLFVNLLRGTGVQGWAGIPPEQGPFVRPLLATHRKDIQAYANERGIPYREDSSNRSPDHLRNRIRSELLPIIEDIRPGSSKAIARSIADLRGWMDQQEKDGVDLKAGDQCLLRDPLLDDQGILKVVVRPLGFHPHTIQRIQEALQDRSTGATFRAGRHRVTLLRQGVLIEMVSGGPEEEQARV